VSKRSDTLLERLRQVRAELEAMQIDADRVKQNLRDREFDIELKRHEAVTIHSWYLHEIELVPPRDRGGVPAMTIAETINAAKDITPKGSKNIHFEDNLGNEGFGLALTVAMNIYPDAPVIIIDTPDVSVYYMNVKKKDNDAQ